MKKTLCILLCLVMLLGMLVGCKKDNVPAASDTTPGDTQPVSDTGDSDTGIRKEMVFEDFSVNGQKREFLMAVRANRYHYLYAEQDATDRVERATYTRNEFIETNFGIDFKIKQLGEKAAWVSGLAVTDGSIDLAVPDYWWLLEQQDLFINLYAREELQFNQEYWYSAWNDGTTINNKLFTVVGDGSLEVWENIEVVFFNKAKANAQTVNLYELVDSGEWTIDKMLQISRNAASGLDDSDESNNVYGSLYDVHSLRSQLFSAGLKIVDTSNGTLDIVAQSRTLNLDILDKVKTLIHDQATNYHSSTARADTNKAKMFTGGKTMFYATALYLGYTINSQSNVPSFGVVPMPKYDNEVQTNYITTSYGVSVFAIPKVALDQHFSAVILDAINYYSEEHTLDAFYNKAMRGQLAEGSDDVRMLDLAKDTMYFDMGWILDEGGQFNLFNAFQAACVKNEEINLTDPMQTSTAKLVDLIAFYNR